MFPPLTSRGLDAAERRASNSVKAAERPRLDGFGRRIERGMSSDNSLDLRTLHA